MTFTRQPPSGRETNWGGARKTNDENILENQQIKKIRLAEREGFEPPDPFGSTVFKTAAFGRSATSPKAYSCIRTDRPKFPLTGYWKYGSGPMQGDFWQQCAVFRRSPKVT